jgi:excisionase family DNA binding protein
MQAALSAPQNAAEALTLLTYGEAAGLLRVCVRTVHTLIKQGEMPVVKIGCRRFITKGDVYNFIQRSRIVAAMPVQ